jgi:catechol 2,3-dioxygenase-like lactoylglutathione lyase family enzyme
MKSVLNIRHTGIVVKDLDRAIKLYTQKLGMREVKRETFEPKDVKKFLTIQGNALTYVKLAAENGDLLELYQFEPPCPENYRHVFRHVAFTVENVDQFWADLYNNNTDLVIVTSPQYDKEKTHKLFFAFDGKEGNMMEFVEEVKNESCSIDKTVGKVQSGCSCGAVKRRRGK